MSPRRLSNQQELILSSASSTAISRVFSTLYSNFSHNEWLHNNIYCSNPVNIIRNRQINNTQISEYIAASAPTHCMDGWSFIGKALHCAVSGDSNTARHLAYYAELRAAMALLASAGIGVFDQTHIVIDSSNNATKISNIGTHDFTWLALNAWSSTPDAASILGKVLQIGTIPFSEWLSKFQGNLSSLAFNWFSAWGIDLRVFTIDKNSRNTVSYRPSHLTSFSSCSATTCSKFVSDLWKNFNPYDITRFNTIDKYLLRKSLQIIDNNNPLYESHNRKIPYQRRIKIMLNSLYNQQNHKEIINAWESFFDPSNNGDNPRLLDEAEKRNIYTFPTHHFEVISRAFLLLRIATGSCNKLITNSTYNSADLEFWWSQLGLERGIWNNRNMPGNNSNDIVSLWDDIDTALTNLDLWNTKNNNPSFSSLLSQQNRSLRILEGCERIGLWGLLP